MRKVAASIDDLFGTVISDAMKLAAKEDGMADSLVWVRDQCIFLAQHGEAFERVRREIEHEASANASTAINPSVSTRPNGGSVVSILDQARRDR